MREGDIPEPKNGTPSTVGADIWRAHWVRGNLKSTVGNQNYLIPADVPVDRVNSVVIWCDPVSIAYAAALRA